MSDRRAFFFRRLFAPTVEYGGDRGVDFVKVRSSRGRRFALGVFDYAEKFEQVTHSVEVQPEFKAHIEDFHRKVDRTVVHGNRDYLLFETSGFPSFVVVDKGVFYRYRRRERLFSLRFVFA